MKFLFRKKQIVQFLQSIDLYSSFIHFFPVKGFFPFRGKMNSTQHQTVVRGP
eukprot:Pgem_evm1s1179